MKKERETELRRKLTEKKTNTRETLKMIQFWFIAVCAVLVLSFMLPIISQNPKEENSIDSVRLVKVLKWIVLSVAILTSVTVLYIKKKNKRSGFDEENE